MGKENIRLMVFDSLELTKDDLEYEGVPESVLDQIDEKQMVEVRNRVSDYMYEHFHESVRKAVRDAVLVPINEDGKDIACINVKDVSGILLNLAVDPENPYQVRIYKAAKRLQNSDYRYKDLRYIGSSGTSCVWATEDGSLRVSVYDDGSIK
jgi:hypothetical protein